MSVTHSGHVSKFNNKAGINKVTIIEICMHMYNSKGCGTVQYCMHDYNVKRASSPNVGHSLKGKQKGVVRLLTNL